MKLLRAWRKRDAAGIVQLIGVTSDGRVRLAHGLSDADEPAGEYFAEFDADSALRFAFELANLARYAKTVKPGAALATQED